MKAQLTCALLLSLACRLPAFAAPQDMLDPPSFTEAVEVNVINVDVRVTDSNGRPITGLRKRDFELFEDGKRVDISNFAAVAGGVSREEDGEAPPPAPGADQAAPTSSEDAWNLIVYVDNFNLHPGNRTRTLQQLRDFLGRELRPGDRVMLASYDQGLAVRLPFSSDPAAVRAALTEVEQLATGGAAIDLQRQQAFREIMAIQEASVADFTNPRPCPLEIARPAHEFAQLRRDEVMRSLGSLTVLVNSLSGVPGRKAVLYVSDGIPATPGEEVFQFLAELCGGGSSSGLGRSTPGNTQETEILKDDEPGEDDARPSGRPEPRQPSMDPLAVYDASALGPWAYKASSQAPIDSQSYSLVKQLGSLVAHANAQRVTLYTLQASGAAAPAASEASAGPTDRLFQFASIGTAQRASLQNSLHAMADGTGGRAMLDVNDFKPELARMREDFDSYYSLGFTPNHKTAGAEHRIEVRVKRKGARLRYRESYRDKTPIERAVDRTLAALFYDIEDNPLKIEIELGEQTPGPSGTVAIPVRLRIPLAKVAVLRGDGAYEGNLRVLVATRAADGRGSAVKQVPVPIRIPKDDVLHALGQFYVYTLTLNLAPGEQKIAVGVRDDTSATTSYLSRAVKVMSSDTAAVNP
jgi:VWFA-related protein